MIAVFHVYSSKVSGGTGVHATNIGRVLQDPLPKNRQKNISWRVMRIILIIQVA